MKSKKIERLEAEIRECREYQIAAGDNSESPQWQDMQKRIEKARKQIRQTRNRNLWAAERYQAHRDCGLVKTPYGWE